MKTKLKTTRQRVDSLLAACPACTADQAQRVYQAMEEEYELGFDEGHRQAHEDGYKQGHKEGFEQGCSRGLEEGRKEAQEEAYSKGHAEGHKSGSIKGYKNGYKAGSASARAERLCVTMVEVLAKRSDRAGLEEVLARLRKESAPLFAPGLPDSQPDQANQTVLPGLPGLLEKQCGQEAACADASFSADGPSGPRGEGSMAGKAPAAHAGGAPLESPRTSIGGAELEAPKASLPARAAGMAGAIRAACASKARRFAKAGLLWPLALPLAFGAGVGAALCMDACLETAVPVDEIEVEAMAVPVPERAVVLPGAEPAGKCKSPASGTGRDGLKDNMAERLAGILARPLAGSPAQDSLDAMPLPEDGKGRQGQQGQQVQPAGSAQNGQHAQRAQGDQGDQHGQRAQHPAAGLAAGTRNGNQAGPGSQASQSGASTLVARGTSGTRDSRGGDGARARWRAGAGQAEADGSEAANAGQGLDQGLSQAPDHLPGQVPGQAGALPGPAGPKGSLGETARLLGEAEAIKLKTRVAKEEAACLKAQIETARLRRELAQADQDSKAGRHATLQARSPREAAGGDDGGAAGDAGGDAAGDPAGKAAPSGARVQAAGASAASKAAASPARLAGAAGARAGTARPAPQALPALALHSLGRIVSIQDINGTLTAAVRTPSGALAMLKPGSRWAGGRVAAVTPRGLRLKLGARTIAVPF